MKKNREDKSNWAIIHTFMDVPQRNSMCSYLKQEKNVIFFSFLLIQNQGTGGQNRSCQGGGLWVPLGGGRRWGNGEGE
jgi:hypothetical protein